MPTKRTSPSTSTPRRRTHDRQAPHPAETARDELKDTVARLAALQARHRKAVIAVRELEVQIQDMEELRDWQAQNPLLKNLTPAIPATLSATDEPESEDQT